MTVSSICAILLLVLCGANGDRDEYEKRRILCADNQNTMRTLASHGIHDEFLLIQHRLLQCDTLQENDGGGGGVVGTGLCNGVPCGSCGDGICDPNENCAADCGAGDRPVVCGDGICDPNEVCDTDCAVLSDPSPEPLPDPSPNDPAICPDTGCTDGGDTQSPTCGEGSYRDTNTNVCVSECPSGYVGNDATRTCEVSLMGNCNAGWFYDAAAGACVQTCPDGMISNTQSRSCDSDCPSGKFRMENSCLTSCPSGYFKSSESRACVTNCYEPFYADIYTGWCTTTCSTGYAPDSMTQTCQYCGEQGCPETTFCSSPALSTASCSPNNQLNTWDCVCSSGYYRADTGLSMFQVRCYETEDVWSPSYTECNVLAVPSPSPSPSRSPSSSPSGSLTPTRTSSATPTLSGSPTPSGSTTGTPTRTPSPSKICQNPNTFQGLEFYKDVVVGTTGYYVPNTVREFTWEFWVMPYTTSTIMTQSCSAKLSSLPSTTNILVFANGHHSYSGGTIIMVGTNGISVLVHASGYFLYSLLSHTHTFPSTTYTHVVITADQTVGFSLYINGAFVKNSCGPLSSPYWIGAEIQQIGGALSNGAATVNSFSGKIGKMSLWARKLAATEISNMYCTELTGAESGLTGYWKLQGQTEAAILRDSSSAGYQFWKQSTTGTVGLSFSETLEGMRILYSNPNIKYTVVAPTDNRAKFTAIGVSPTRVAYYLQYSRDGTLWWVYVSMDPYTSPANNFNALQIPDGNYWNFYQANVNNVFIMSNHPSVGNYTAAAGRVEIYGCCASTTSIFGDGSSAVYDYDDTLHQGCTMSCRHGQFAVFDMVAKKTLFAWTSWMYDSPTPAGVGIGNNDATNPHYAVTSGVPACGYAQNPDWSCSANAALVSNFKLDILVGNPSATPTPTVTPSSSSSPSRTPSITATPTPSPSCSMAYVAAVVSDYSCPSGFTLDGTSCVRSYTATLNAYNCQAYSGYSLSGAECRYSYSGSPIYGCIGSGNQDAIYPLCWVASSQTNCYQGGEYIGASTCRLSISATGICTGSWYRSGSFCYNDLASGSSARCGSNLTPTNGYWTSTLLGAARQITGGWSCLTSQGGPGGFWARGNDGTVRCFANTIQTTCSGGTFVYSSNTAVNCRCRDAFPQAYSCPSGYGLSGTTCVSNYMATYECQAGYTLDTNMITQCYRNSDVLGYTCPNGGSLSGSTCTITHSATPEYTCPQGGILSGTTCTITQPATPVYSCPNGGTLVGTRCTAGCGALSSPSPTSTPSPSPSSSGSTTPSTTPSATPSSSHTPTPSRTASVTVSVTPTQTPSVTPSPSYIHTCGVITVAGAACTFTDTTANCRCVDGLYSATGVPAFTLTCGADWTWSAPQGNCYKCTDPGDPFYSTRLDTALTAGFLTSITHECKLGFWNSLTSEATATATCLTTGRWSSLITCSACSIPARYANPVTQDMLSATGSPFSVTARVVTRSDEVIGGISPAYRINLWCHPMYGPNLNSADPQYPVQAECSQATGEWSKALTCILCRTQNARRRCSNLTTCRSPCRFGPWTLPVDAYNIMTYVLP